MSASALAAAPKSGLIAFIERQPGSAFGVFLAVHFAVWTALPTILYANLPLDLIEALTYGREWPLGSDKLPPLPWWLVEIMYRLFGADVAYYALAEIVVIAAFALIFATARPLVGPTRALVAVLIIDGLHYFGYTAAKFNHDVIQLPFWALAGYAFHAALKRGKLGHWLLLGFAFGGALWAKYFVVVLAVPYALFLLLDRDARRALRTPGPWLGIALALIITCSAPDLADREPFSAVRLRGRPIGAGTRLVRSHPASGFVCRRPALLHAAHAVHRRNVHMAAAAIKISPPHLDRACARPGAGSCGEGLGVGVARFGASIDGRCAASRLRAGALLRSEALRRAKARPPSLPSPTRGEGSWSGRG